MKNSNSDNSSSKFKSNLPLRWIFLNKVDAILQKIGISFPRFDIKSMCNEAGFTPTSQDEAFLKRFQLLLEDAKHSKFNLYGRFNIYDQYTHLLRIRAHIHQWIIDHPETLQVPVKQPLFIVGLPRSGTTLLYNLMGLDPSRRTPLQWELMDPIPPLPPGSEEKKTRIQNFEGMFQEIISRSPGIMAIHDVNLQSPEECYFFLETSAFSSSFILYCDIPILMRHLLTSAKKEKKEVYEEYRTILQIFLYYFQDKCWLSKSPYHLLSLETLLETFPDGYVIRPHRNPLDTIPSLCSLVATLRAPFVDKLDLHGIGHTQLEWFLEANKKAEETNATLNDRIINVKYSSLVANPLGTLKEIYDQVGCPFTKTHEERIVAWLADNPQSKHGVHKYSAEQFGLDPAQIERSTREYNQKYLS